MNKQFMGWPKKTIAFIIIGWIAGAALISVYMEMDRDENLKRFLTGHNLISITSDAEAAEPNWNDVVWCAGFCQKGRICEGCAKAIKKVSKQKACSSGQTDKCDGDYCMAHPKKAKNQ